MSAGRLREAARLMRERAEAVDTSPDESESIDCPWTWAEQIAFIVADPDATHLTAFGHPAVALAVADWLEVAAGIDECAREHGRQGIRSGHPALAVADAYLGESS